MGRIVTSSTNGKPLSGMKVILGKEKIAQTNDDGVYIFEGVKSGSYSLQVEGGENLFHIFRLPFNVVHIGESISVQNSASRLLRIGFYN